MTTIKIEISPREMKKALADMDNYEKVVSKQLQGAVARATFRVGAGARMRAPVNFGRLRQSIKEKIGKLRGEISVNVNYAGAVEFGTKAHEIRPKVKKALAFKPGAGFRFWDESGRVVVKSVKHPGTKAQPFLTPAVKEEARGFAKNIKTIIEKAAKR
jgi:HK97 gp10 family phage protein